jgi:hypothetical protein
MYYVGQIVKNKETNEPLLYCGFDNKGFILRNKKFKRIFNIKTTHFINLDNRPAIGMFAYKHDLGFFNKLSLKTLKQEPYKTDAINAIKSFNKE